jgi:hypothetical protein
MCGLGSYNMVSLIQGTTSIARPPEEPAAPASHWAVCCGRKGEGSGKENGDCWLGRGAVRAALPSLAHESVGEVVACPAGRGYGHGRVRGHVQPEFDGWPGMHGP